MKMSESELRAITDGEMRQAVGYWSGKLAQQRQKAMSYYYGEAKGDLTPPEIEGRSSVVSPDVRNTIESMLPQLMVKFAGNDTVVEFEATKPGDEPMAEQATDYVNHIFFVRNHGERITYHWLKDALLSKNGIIKVWWDTSKDETREEYRDLSEIELAQLMDDPEIEIIEQESEVSEEDQKQREQAISQLSEQLMQLPEGHPQAAQIQAQIAQIQATPPVMEYDVVCKRVKEGGRIKVENVPPEEFLISRKAKTIADATFIGHRVARTVSQLKSMGYPAEKIDNISSDDQATALNMERIERLQFDDEMAYLNTDTVQTMDDSQRVVWVTECYIRCDYDGDGIAELRKVVRAGNEILDNEIVDCAPFISICPIPMPHKFFGLSIADLAMDSQRINTSVIRSVLDNIYLGANKRYFAVENQVSLDDLLNSRPGGIVRIKQPGAVGPLDPLAGNLQEILGFSEYMKGFLEDSTGFTRYNQGSDGDSLNQTATGLTNITNRADMRLDNIARVMADGFRDLFRMILKLCSQYQSKPDVVKLRGEWVPVNPREWRNGFDATINVGLGTNNKAQTLQHLTLLSQAQTFGLKIGTATPENVFQLQKEIVKAMGFRSSDKFFVDPSKAPPKPSQPNPAEMQMQVEQMKAQLKAQTDAQSKQAEMQLERERMKWQAEVDAHRQQVEAQQQAAKMQMQQELELSKIAAEMQLAQFKAQLEQETALKLAHINNEVELIKTQMQTQSTITAQQDMAADTALEDGDDLNVKS